MTKIIADLFFVFPDFHNLFRRILRKEQNSLFFKKIITMEFCLLNKMAFLCNTNPN